MERKIERFVIDKLPNNLRITGEKLGDVAMHLTCYMEEEITEILVENIQKKNFFRKIS
jgi:hypothetical protein